jgi:hypothetical protein
MTHTRGVVAAAVVVAVEAFTAAVSGLAVFTAVLFGLEGLTEVAPFMPVGAIEAMPVGAMPVVPVTDTDTVDTDIADMDLVRQRLWGALRSMAAVITIAATTIIMGSISAPGNILTIRIDSR